MNGSLFSSFELFANSFVMCLKFVIFIRMEFSSFSKFSGNFLEIGSIPVFYCSYFFDIIPSFLDAYVFSVDLPIAYCKQQKL